MVFRSAYIDPNSGSIIMQVLIGGVVGAGYSFRRRLVGLKSTVQTKLQKKEQRASSPDQE